MSTPIPTPIRVAIIGTGYLGKFHVQKYTMLPNVEVIGVCDTCEKTADQIGQQYQCRSTTDFCSLLDDVDAVSIATPTLSHAPIAKVCLEKGVHVLLEKPITSTVAEANELIALAEQNQCILQIGHLERFNPALTAMEKVLDQPQFIESFRLAPFKLRGSDINVILDLMIHDIDIIQYLVNSPIIDIHANGSCVLSKHIDIANARIAFENGCVANVTASRVSLKHKRKLRVFQHDAYLTLDMENKKLACHRKGPAAASGGVAEIICEEQVFEQTDALQAEIESFLTAITHKTKPVVSGIDGRDALATAIAITQIIQDSTTLHQPISNAD